MWAVATTTHYFTATLGDVFFLYKHTMVRLGGFMQLYCVGVHVEEALVEYFDGQ